MKKNAIGLTSTFRNCLLGLTISLLAVSCSMNETETECPGCEEIVIDDTLILLNGGSTQDSTGIVIDDTLILLNSASSQDSTNIVIDDTLIL